jgi:cellulose synthase/poly-beta-1,6-N-acetylglucosamine synthase-like glycosyltransferase
MYIFNYFIEIHIFIISIFFILSFFIQIYYYLRYYLKIYTYKPKYIDDSQVPISVIITAKNEEKNLKQFLPSILEQDYPDYEVIVVDDCSNDDTSIVLSEFKAKYPHLKVTFIAEDDKFKHGKKLAITVGVKAAKNEWLLFTDADCMPLSKNWIKQMSRNFTNENEIVLGYSGYKSEKSFLNKFIRFDTIFIALQYLSFAICKKPYMGVGRNMAYRKSLFFKNKGFASHYHIYSGDDDLFINQVATSKNTRVEFSPESHILSLPEKSFKDWINQKRRHLKAGFYYNKKTKYLLAFELTSRIIFYFSFITLLVLKTNLYIFVLSIFLLRLIIQHLIINFTINKLKENKLLLFTIVYDIIMPFINLIAVIINYFSPSKNKWK